MRKHSAIMKVSKYILITEELWGHVDKCKEFNTEALRGVSSGLSHDVDSMNSPTTINFKVGAV